MSDDTLRARLEALNRAPLPSPPGERPIAPRPAVSTLPNVVAAAESAVAALRNGRRRPPAAPTPSRQPSGDICPVAGLLHSGYAVETPVGPHWQIDVPVDRLWQGGAKLITARQEFLRQRLAAAQATNEPSPILHPEFASFIAALPDRTLALDLETCGLAGSALFLIGLLRNVGNGPAVQLLFARNYAEEAAVLWSLWQTVANHEVLLTFNGKSFDWPMVLERSIRHRLDTKDLAWASPTRPPALDSILMGTEHSASAGAAKVHIDILYHSRRRWKGRLPNCRLQTLELHVCRRTRVANIPGHAIPGVYAEYVRTGFEREIDTVLYHNALDLVTLFDLTHRLAC